MKHQETFVSVDPAVDGQHTGIAVVRVEGGVVEVLHTEVFRRYSAQEIEREAQRIAHLFGASKILKEENERDQKVVGPSSDQEIQEALSQAGPSRRVRVHNMRTRQDGILTGWVDQGKGPMVTKYQARFEPGVNSWAIAEDLRLLPGYDSAIEDEHEDCEKPLEAPAEPGMVAYRIEIVPSNPGEDGQGYHWGVDTPENVAQRLEEYAQQARSFSDGFTDSEAVAALDGAVEDTEMDLTATGWDAEWVLAKLRLRGYDVVRSES